MVPKNIYEVSAGAVSATIFGQRESLVQKQTEQVLKTFQRVKDKQLALERKLEECVFSLSLLDKPRNEGSISPQGVYAGERTTLLEKEQQLMASVSALRTMVSQFTGQSGDGTVFGARGTNDDSASIDDIVHCYPEPTDAKKSVKSKRTPKEKKFRQDLLKAYGSEHDAFNLAWCPIAHEYVQNATAAHIVHANVGEVTARALFGDDEDHIWNTRNGIIVTKFFEKLIDKGKAVILPFSNSPDETRFKFFLLTKDIGRPTIRLTAEQLHNRELEFKTAFRPGKRYLYFQSAVTLLRRRRDKVPGHLEDLHILPFPSRSLWASPGPYLKRSILYKFSRLLGCLSVDEADRFWGVDASPLEPLSDALDDLSATLSTKAALASITGLDRRSGSGRAANRDKARSVSSELEYEDEEDEEDEE